MEALILVVDDSHVVVETLTFILSNQGYEVESRSDGESCWDHLVAGTENTKPKPDLLLLDLNMPGIDGLTLLRRIRADERFATGLSRLCRLRVRSRYRNRRHREHSEEQPHRTRNPRA